jgi:predicted Ser/Thr protein kinase
MDNPAGLAGQTIGKYRVIEHLGRGGMAEVYKAYQPNLDRYVALKLMHAFLAADQDFIQRFEREAKNVAALRHPNIVQVYDFDVHNGTPFMVMEYIEGGTLKSHLEDLMRAGNKQTLTEAIHIVGEIGQALSYAHSRQMIHRDVKPANVLLEKSGRVILTDFGIAKILTGPSYTVTGATIGTPSYMSPEQGLGRPGDHRSDIYALGVMLYQLATGQLPYEADTPLAVMLKHVNEPLPLPRTFKPDLPEGIERIILKAMAKNPDDRFQSADEMLEQMRNLDTARLLAIPPASMAAGPAAHAATVAAGAAAGTMAGVVASGSTATQAVPAGATVVARPGVVPPPPPPPTAPVAPADSGRRFPMGLVAALGVILLLLVVVGGAFAFTNGFGLLNQPAPTDTPAPPTSTATLEPSSTNSPPPSATIPAGSATPDLIGTQLASLQQTQEAIQAAVASATASNTPDLTQTQAACTFGFSISSQQPEDKRNVPVSSNISKTLTLLNTGTCPFEPGTVLTETNAVAPAPPISATVPAIQPNDTGTVAFTWPGRRTAGEVVRVFEIHGPDDALIGEPITLTLRYLVAATLTPVPTATQPPPPATATSPAAAGLTDLFLQSVTDCRYVGDNGMDYQCTGIVGRVGGVGPFTVSVDGVDSRHIDIGQTITIQMRGRRCTLWAHTINLFDDGTLTGISKQQSFDPAGNGSLFPGGSCTLP